ncbi:ASCH domain-containing protein [Parvularcula oceani]|uniref:ASCH domain-containing protein n=1 Tax=Parvularcula oceani TaxID=1247963 RepID=UPI000561228F|nr:ASCH domain-containing protein [Parvularcula oceani]
MTLTPEALWRAYLASRPQHAAPRGPVPPAWHFCDNEADADACLDLVLAGKKRATAPSLAELRASGQPVPQVGDLHIVTDFAGRARCLLRTERVEILRFRDVTEAHAAAEGEGDGSLSSWRSVHGAYYRRVLANTADTFSQDLPVVFETFELLYAAEGEV